MERPDAPQTLTPPPGLQTLATATACFRASSFPPPQPQTLDMIAAPSVGPELGLELSLNLPSQPIAAKGNPVHDFINFGDGGGDQIGSGMDVFSIFGDEGEAPTQRGVDLFAIFGDEEELAVEHADAVMNSMEKEATENADSVMNSMEKEAMENADAFVTSVGGEGTVAGSRSDAFMLFGDEEGAPAGSGFDTTMLFGDEGAATETGMQAEGDTLVDGLNPVVDSENGGRTDRLVGTDSIGDALDSSEAGRSEITTTGKSLMNPPDVSDESNNRKKRRSMADLVIGTDLGMDGLGNEEGIAEMNQGERNEVHDSGDADGAGMEVEGAVSTQRARKKSKYLSPPYTDPSWSNMQAALHVDAHALVPWSPKKGKDITNSSSFPLSPSKGKGLNDKMSKGKGSNDKMSPSATYASVNVNVFLSDLLSLTVDHYHLKGSRSQRTFRSFYEEFRSSEYLCLDLGNDKVHPVDSETLARGVGVPSKVKATRTGNRGKDGAVTEAAISLNLNLGKVKHGSATPKKKVTKNEVDGQGPLNLATGSANSSLGKRKANASGMPIPESTSYDPFEFSEGDSPKKRKSNGAALAVTPLNSRDPSGLPEGGQAVSTRLTKSNQSGKKKKGSKINKKGKSSASKTGKGSKEDTSQQKRKIVEALSGCPAALIMTFSPGSTLPSRDELVSTFSPYGDLIEPSTELLEDSCSACVVFAKSSDAEKAFHSPNKKTAFRSPLAGCRLRYLIESMPSPSVAQPVKKTPRPSPSVAQSVKKTQSPSPSVAQSPKKTPSPSPSVAQSPKKTPSPSPSVALSPKKTPSPSPSVALSPKKTPSPSPSVAQPLKRTLRPSSSVAQPVKKTARASRLVAQRFKKTPLPNIRKNLERLLRSLIGPFSVGQAAGTAEWMKLEGMEELVGDMKALLEKIDGILTQPPPATSH